MQSDYTSNKARIGIKDGGAAVLNRLSANLCLLLGGDEKESVMEYDPDDVPVVTYGDVYWHYANRWAENVLRMIRALGLL